MKVMVSRWAWQEAVAMSSSVKEVAAAAVRPGVDVAKHNTAIPEQKGCSTSALDFSDDPNAEHSRERYCAEMVVYQSTENGETLFYTFITYLFSFYVSQSCMVPNFILLLAKYRLHSCYRASGVANLGQPCHRQVPCRRPLPWQQRLFESHRRRAGAFELLFDSWPVFVLFAYYY